MRHQALAAKQAKRTYGDTTQSSDGMGMVRVAEDGLLLKRNKIIGDDMDRYKLLKCAWPTKGIQIHMS